MRLLELYTVDDDADDSAKHASIPLPPKQYDNI